MGTQRFTGLANGFSKKVDNLKTNVALHYMHYNFARIHNTLRVTSSRPAKGRSVYLSGGVDARRARG